MQVVTPEIGGEATSVSGDFDEVFLILPHADITITATASFTIDASWATYAGGTQTEYVVYDTGVVDSFLDNGQITIRGTPIRSEEHTSELQSRRNLVCRLLLEKKKNTTLIPCFRFLTLSHYILT